MNEPIITAEPEEVSCHILVTENLFYYDAEQSAKDIAVYKSPKVILNFKDAHDGDKAIEVANMIRDLLKEEGLLASIVVKGFVFKQEPFKPTTQEEIA
jgi:hypothetical protein